MGEEKRRSALLVGFGGPESLNEVPAFVASVLGRMPREHVISMVVDRYATIGGRSPLPEMTRRQAALVAEELARRGLAAEVYVGMLHARPSIGEAVADILADEVEELTVVSLAPYRCEVSTDAYHAAVVRALDSHGPRLRFASDWNLEPGYIWALTDMLAKALEPAPPDTPVIFTAHSLPERMIVQGDPYADQLAATAAEVARHLGLNEWHLGYQSVSAVAQEPWLGPTVEQILGRIAADGATSVLIDPIGFISDHVETLYDNDLEHRSYAEALGLGFHRCRCLNDHPGLIATLADLVVAASDRG